MKMTIGKIFILCLVLMLTACSNSQRVSSEGINEPPVGSTGDNEVKNANPSDDKAEPVEETEALDMKIARASDELLSTFSTIHKFDYTIIMEALYGSDFKYDNGEKLVIWSNAPIQDFYIITIEHDFINDKILFTPKDFFGHIEELLPGQAFVINAYVDVGTFPKSGITFKDESGNTHYYAIQLNLSDEGDPYLLDPFDVSTEVAESTLNS